MYKIIEKQQLSADVFFMRVMAPEIAKNRKAGQFVLVQLDLEFGERVPLTIADANAATTGSMRPSTLPTSGPTRVIPYKNAPNAITVPQITTKLKPKIVCKSHVPDTIQSFATGIRKIPARSIPQPTA